MSSNPRQNHESNLDLVMKKIHTINDNDDDDDGFSPKLEAPNITPKSTDYIDNDFSSKPETPSPTLKSTSISTDTDLHQKQIITTTDKNRHQIDIDVLSQNIAQLTNIIKSIEKKSDLNEILFEQKIQDVRNELQVDRMMKEQEQEDDGFDENSTVYSTGGYYMHAIAVTTSPNVTRFRSWTTALGLIFVVALQLLILQMILFDSITEVLTKDSTQVCGQLMIRRAIVFIFLSLLYSSVLYDDIKESKIEEAVLNHAIKNGVNYPRSTELIRIGLRFRRFILPWKLTQTAVYMIIQEDRLSTNEIVLNFLSVAFIGEADDLLGRMICTSLDHTRADRMVEKARKDKVTVSYLWVKILAALPTLFISVASTIILQLKQCGENLFQFSIFSVMMMPLIMILIHDVIKVFREKESSTSIERHIRGLANISMNLLAYALFALITILPFPEGLNSTRSIIFFCAYCLIIGMQGCFREFLNRVIFDDRHTSRNWLFYTFWYSFSLATVCFMMASVNLLFFPFFGSLFASLQETLG